MNGEQTAVAVGDTVSELAAYWEFGRQGMLVLPRCGDCAAWVWYPRVLCPACGGENLTWARTGGNGTVYTYTIVRRPARGSAGASSSVVAYVELAEGVRILTQIRDVAEDDVRIGLPVSAVFDEEEDGAAVLRFRPNLS